MDHFFMCLRHHHRSKLRSTEILEIFSSINSDFVRIGSDRISAKNNPKQRYGGRPQWFGNLKIGKVLAGF